MALSLRFKASIASIIFTIGAVASGLYLHRIINNVHSERMVIIPGIEYEHRTQRHPCPISMHILKVDPTKACMEIALAENQASGTEKVSSITSRHKAIAGINAGFFESINKTDGLHGCTEDICNGLPVGALKHHSTWLHKPIRGAVHLGWTKDGKTTKIGKLSPEWSEMEFIVGGIGTLIHNGKHATADELIKESSSFAHLYGRQEPAHDHENKLFVTGRNARTAVGVLPDGQWLIVVVEGSIPGVSEGINLPDLGDFMEKKGCLNAINLGGSSSSTLFLDGVLKNLPTVPKNYGTDIEGGEQLVNAALVMKPLGSKKLGDILVDLKQISQTQLSYAEKESYAHDQALGQFLIQQGMIKESQLENALEMKSRLAQYKA